MNKRTISVLKSVIDTLNETLDRLVANNSHMISHDRISHEIMQVTGLLDSLTLEPQAGNMRIESLLLEYGMSDMNLDDVKNMAARYSYTYPDSQVRCILHIVGHSEN